LRFSDEMVGTHGATEPLVEVYRHQGVAMVPTVSIAEFKKSEPSPATLVVAPPGGLGGVWMKRFKAVSVGFASGWMAIRGHRRRRGYENGFVLSDHADWPSLIRTVEETGAKKVYVTHGYEDAVVVEESLLKILVVQGATRGGSFADILKLPYSLVEPTIRELREKDLIAPAGGSGIGGNAGLDFGLTPKGQEVAATANASRRTRNRCSPRSFSST
jgi:hypothetical protein